MEIKNVCALLVHASHGVGGWDYLGVEDKNDGATAFKELTKNVLGSRLRFATVHHSLSLGL